MRFKILVFLIWFFSSNVLSQKVDFEPLVETPLGDVVGTTTKTPGYRDFYSFLGIRYAEAPVGHLRWKAPVPIGPWHGIFDARTHGPWCYQNTTFSRMFTENFGIQLSEDCLRINVHTRNLNPVDGKLLPVVVDIHGGGFYLGGTSFDFLKPVYLMEQNIVHVSMNYRLGVLGFLSSGTADIPGNAGLKDQVQALKWVRRNIKSFGGDPDNVTIMGYSAGGYSVASHLASPMSAGLFHRAVAQSGSITNHYPLQHNNLEVLHHIAHLVDCSYASTFFADTIKCLIQTPAIKLENVIGKLMDSDLCKKLILMPVIENDYGQERFFSEQPVASFHSGNFNKAPVLVGMATDEFANEAHHLLNSDAIRSRMNSNFHEMTQKCLLQIRVPGDQLYTISEAFRTHFVPSQLENTPESLRELQKPYGDSRICHGVHRLVQLLNTQVNVYYYKFAYIGRFSFFMHPGHKPWGVEHSDELQYYFEMKIAGPVLTPSDPEYTVMQKVTRLIYNFALTGNPNNVDDEYIGKIEWIPFNIDDQNYLEIADEFEMKKGLFLERFKVWDELFPTESLITKTQSPSHTEL